MPANNSHLSDKLNKFSSRFDNSAWTSLPPCFTSNPLHLQGFSYCATTRPHQSFPAVCGSLTSWQAWSSTCGWESTRPPLYASAQEHHVQKLPALPSPLLLHQVTKLSLVWLDESALGFTVNNPPTSLYVPCCGAMYSLSRRLSTTVPLISLMRRTNKIISDPFTSCQLSKLCIESHLLLHLNGLFVALHIRFLHIFYKFYSVFMIVLLCRIPGSKHEDTFFIFLHTWQIKADVIH